MTLKKRYEIIKSDKLLFSIFAIHLLLAFFHFAYTFYSDGVQAILRCSFCFLIALATFFHLRKGFALSILLYGYVLLYFNNFFNYTSFLFLLFAVYCLPKIQKPALILYALNVFIAFSIRDLKILAFGIHAKNCLLFYICAKYLFATITPHILLLTNDERIVLDELAAGKLQKQIEQFSQNTVTRLLKNAMTRNKCNTKQELLNKYLNENHQNIVINSKD
ncbi:MAG: hypothetical protein J6S85_12750 [Methanobrevibacter sp.]|nr:hypothetical protein [Methanobrevibacter sp.]